MHMLAMKNTVNNTMYIVQELHTFLYLKFHYDTFYFH